MTPTELLALRGARLRAAIARSDDYVMLATALSSESRAPKPRRVAMDALERRMADLYASGAAVGEDPGTIRILSIEEWPEIQELPPGDSGDEVQPVGVPGGGDAHADPLATGGPAPEPGQLDARDAGLIEGTEAVPTTLDEVLAEAGWSWLGFVD